MSEHEISKAVVRRLPRYYRYLGDLLEAKVERISSGELSELMNVTASQIRQDLNNFGGFGQQGYGYNVENLYNEIQKILGLDRDYNLVVIGGGNLGQALTNYVESEKRRFYVKGIFDINPALNGKIVCGVKIRMTEELPYFLQNNEIQIAALTLPKNGAEVITPILVENGIKALWNFAHTDLQVPGDVIVENVHLSDSLMQLSYELSHRESD